MERQIPAIVKIFVMRAMTLKHLFELIPYRRTVWVTGFLKTTVSSAIISTGVVILFNSITNHPYFTEWNEVGIVIGLFSIVVACVYVAIIDRWKENKKKEELETIEDYIDKKAEEIANLKVLKKLEELEED